MGIDHGDCLISSLNDTLKIEYLGLDPLDQEFDQEVFHLVSRENQDKYIEIMRTYNIEEEAISWTTLACTCLRFIEDNPEEISLTSNEVAAIFKALHASRRDFAIHDMFQLFQLMANSADSCKTQLNLGLTVDINEAIATEINDLQKSIQTPKNENMQKSLQWVIDNLSIVMKSERLA